MTKQLSDCCKAGIRLTGEERPNAFACEECGRIIGTPVPAKWWVTWYSARNGNDGRRDSAIGHNYSKPHITKDKERTLCGREIKMWPTFYRFEGMTMSKDFCKKCKVIHSVPSFQKKKV